MWSDLIFGSRHHQHIWKGYCGHKVGASNSVCWWLWFSTWKHDKSSRCPTVQTDCEFTCHQKKKKHFSKCPHRSEELLGKSGKMLVHKFPSGYLMMKVNTGLMVRNLYQSHAVSSHSIISLSLIYQKRLLLVSVLFPDPTRCARTHTEVWGTTSQLWEIVRKTIRVDLNHLHMWFRTWFANIVHVCFYLLSRLPKINLTKKQNRFRLAVWT